MTLTLTSGAVKRCTVTPKRAEAAEEFENVDVMRLAAASASSSLWTLTMAVTTMLPGRAVSCMSSDVTLRIAARSDA